MTVTLHPGPGRSLPEMVRDLVRLADGDINAIRTGRGGLVVDDELARTYLLARPQPTTLARPQMVPPALRALIGRREQPLRSRAQTAAGTPARIEE